MRQFSRERRVPVDIAMLQQGGPERVILAPEPQAVFDRAACVAHLQVQVPQHVQHRLDHALNPASGLVRNKEQQVDVRKRGHLSPAIAAHRDQRDPFALGGVRLWVQALRGKAINRVDDGIRQVAIRVGAAACCYRALCNGLGDAGAFLGDPGFQDRDRRRADLRM